MVEVGSCWQSLTKRKKNSTATITKRRERPWTSKRDSLRPSSSAPASPSCSSSPSCRPPAPQSHSVQHHQLRTRKQTHLSLLRVLGILGVLGLNGEEPVESALLLRRQSQAKLVGSLPHAVLAASADQYRLRSGQGTDALEAVSLDQELNEPIHIRRLPLKLHTCCISPPFLFPARKECAPERPSQA